MNDLSPETLSYLETLAKKRKPGTASQAEAIYTLAAIILMMRTRIEILEQDAKKLKLEGKVV